MYFNIIAEQAFSELSLGVRSEHCYRALGPRDSVSSVRILFYSLWEEVGICFRLLRFYTLDNIVVDTSRLSPSQRTSPRLDYVQW